MQWRFILPLPPSVNHQYTERDGRRVLSREARHYKNHLQRAFKRLKAAGKLQLKPFETFQFSLLDDFNEPSTSPNETFLQLRLEFFFKTQQRRDLDNGLKIVQDLVCEAFGMDDRNVVAVELVKRVDARNPRLEVTVSALRSWDFCREGELTVEALDLRPFVPTLPPRRHKGSRKTFSLSEWLEGRDEGLTEI